MVTSTLRCETSATAHRSVSNPLTHMLFIDDNRADNYLISTYIELDNAPIVPHFELNAIHAMKYLTMLDESNFPDIIFVDINMPLKDGFEFVEDFSHQFSHFDTNIYIMSSSIRPSDKEKIKRFNNIIKAYVEKPVKIEFLMKLIGSGTLK